MKKAFCIIFLLFYSIITFAQTETINGVKFNFKLITTRYYDQDKKVELYRGDKKLLTHVLLREGGDCSIESIELGTYEVRKSHIIFYTYWATADRMGRDLYPFGFRKQTYSVNQKGIVSLVESILYIEDYRQHEGLNYLFQFPQTRYQLRLFKEYIAMVEKDYSGTFVFGERKKLLEKEVRKKLNDKMRIHTKDWERIYGKNNFKK